MADTPLRLQRALAAEAKRSARPDFDPGPLDGKSGPKTQAAYDAWKSWASGLPPGIDISRWQGHDIDWKKVAASGVKFAYIKATDGTGRDPLFAEHWKEARDAGILVGAYLFYRPGKDPIAEAAFYSQVVGNLKGCLPPAIDVERDGAGADGQEGTADDVRATEAQVLTCAKHVEQLTGKRPFIYSYGPFLDSHDIEMSAEGFDLWIADYRRGPPTVPPDWNNYLIHQYAGDDGVQLGVPGACDLNRFRGTYAELKARAGL